MMRWSVLSVGGGGSGVILLVGDMSSDIINLLPEGCTRRGP